MSKTSQPIELQRLTENSYNGMSGHTDPTLTEVGAVPPVYFSVDEAQSITKDFKSRQVSVILTFVLRIQFRTADKSRVGKRSGFGFSSVIVGW